MTNSVRNIFVEESKKVGNSCANPARLDNKNVNYQIQEVSAKKPDKEN